MTRLKFDLTSRKLLFPQGFSSLQMAPPIAGREKTQWVLYYRWGAIHSYQIRRITQQLVCPDMWIIHPYPSLKIPERKEETIYTDSQYGFGVVHTFRKICTEWGLINSKGWDLIHKELITQVLESLLLPEGIAVVHIPGQQQSYSLETQRNRLADGVAKEMVLRSEAPNFHLTPTHPPPSITPVFKPWEEEQLAEVGASKTSEGKWLLPDRKEMLSKLILRKLLTQVT